MESLETQVQRCWDAFCVLRGNLVLFHRFLADHLEAALPVAAAMVRHCPNPVILPLAWTNGRALVATGSPFEPVLRPEGLRAIGQCNNCCLFPGLGLAGVREGLAPDDLGEEDVHELLERARWRPEYPELATSVEQP